MATVPRLQRYYRGATTSCSACPSAYWFASRLRRCLRIRVRHCAPAALQARRRAGIYVVHAGHPPSSDLAHGQEQDLPGFLAPHPCDSAPLHDPGRPVTPRRSRRFRCCPQIDHTEGVVIATLEAHCDASSPAVYASRRALPHAMQEWSRMSISRDRMRLCIEAWAALPADLAGQGIAAVGYGRPAVEQKLCDALSLRPGKGSGPTNRFDCLHAVCAQSHGFSGLGLRARFYNLQRSATCRPVSGAA